MIRKVVGILMNHKYGHDDNWFYSLHTTTLNKATQCLTSLLQYSFRFDVRVSTSVRSSSRISHSRVMCSELSSEPRVCVFSQHTLLLCENINFRWQRLYTYHLFLSTHPVVFHSNNPVKNNVSGCISIPGAEKACFMIQQLSQTAGCTLKCCWNPNWRCHTALCFFIPTTFQTLLITFEPHAFKWNSISFLHAGSCRVKKAFRIQMLTIASSKPVRLSLNGKANRAQSDWL